MHSKTLRLIRIATLSAASLCGGHALAADYYNGPGNNPDNNGYYRPPPPPPGYDQRYYDDRRPPPPPRREMFGVVDSIQIERQGGSSGAGVIIGSILGGVLGNQVGSGNGRTAATVVGAVGGAVAGNQIERRGNEHDIYVVNIHMRDGRGEIIRQDNIGDLRPGDRVRVEEGRIYRF